MTGAPRVLVVDDEPAILRFLKPALVAGGYEVHITEGYSHVDVLTAEDTAGNNVLAPLAAFLDRNSQ